MPIRCAGSTGAASNAVDIFDATSGTWSTAALSVARDFLAATSLPNAGLAIFAGGTSAYVSIFVNTGFAVWTSVHWSRQKSCYGTASAN